MLFCGALLIQRLEGSRLQESLCTLNRSERVRRDQAPAELGGMPCRFDGGMVLVAGEHRDGVLSQG